MTKKIPAGTSKKSGRQYPPQGLNPCYLQNCWYNCELRLPKKRIPRVNQNHTPFPAAFTDMRKCNRQGTTCPSLPHASLKDKDLNLLLHPICNVAQFS